MKILLMMLKLIEDNADVNTKVISNCTLHKYQIHPT